MRALTDIHAWVRGRVRTSRFEHIQRVAALANELAIRWGASKHQVAMAALLHDCARDISIPKLLELSSTYNIHITYIEEQSPVLLHAAVGAELAKHELNIDDDKVIDAIRYHTTGRAGMALIEKIVFIADYAEPARSFPGVEHIRTLLHSDIDGAVRRALDQTLQYVIRRGQLIHPRTVEARNALYVHSMQDSEIDPVLSET